MTKFIQRFPKRTGSSDLVIEGQGSFDLQVEVQREIDGIGMGVLNDGTPFLSQRGLANLCGVQNAHIGTMSSQWHEDKPRITTIKRILASRGLQVEAPHIPVQFGSTTVYAYPEPVCMAILEYYAFEAGQFIQREAIEKFRWLATRSLRDVIYDQVGYRPKSGVARTWQQFHDRVSLTYDSVPDGYFCVFKEIAGIMVALINAGAPVGDSFVPDISVGIAWSNYWKDNGLTGVYGERRQFEHNYPDYFPQAKTNPQEPYCYPDVALPSFRKWLREVYMPDGLPKYLKRKEKDGELPSGTAKVAIEAMSDRHKLL